MNVIFQLVYISRETQRFDKESLGSLLTKAKQNNADLNVTGALIYNGGRFLQVLEGQQQQVEALYHSIKQDNRHADVRLLYTGESKVRYFGNWSMNMFNLECDKPKNLSSLKDIVSAAANGEKFAGLSAPLALLREFKSASAA
ncbi:MAG: BLUF domain-containing protein [Aestuariibacter sp.]